MKNLLLTLGLISAGVASFATPAFADQYGCQTEYGSGTNCSTVSLTLNKTVQNPSTGQYVDNLGVNDPKYSPSQNVNFEITITNTGNTTLNNINVTDVLPQYISYITAPGKDNGQTITYTIGNLNPGQSETDTVVGQFANSSTLPTGITCVTNQAQATGNNGFTASDTAQACAQNNVLGTSTTTTSNGLTVYATPAVTKTPPTGPNMLSLFAIIPTLFAGLKLRSKAIRG